MGSDKRGNREKEKVGKMRDWGAGEGSAGRLEKSWERFLKY